MLLKIPCSIDGAMEIAGRARGTPRIANRLLKRVRDFADVMGNGEITQEIAHMALDRLEIDELGLDSNDRRMLEMIIKGYSGGPVGLETLASALGEETVTLEDVCEPDAAGLSGENAAGTLCYCIGVSASGLSAAGFRRRYGRSDEIFHRRILKQHCTKLA